MSKIQQFKDLAKQYGFKILKDGEAYRLCAKNTDKQWTRWISYYPEQDTVTFFGNTDYLNIWLCDTRKDFTPEMCVKFVEDLNNLFELKEDKFLVRELIDPEDWQEIADVHDAYEDERYSPAKDIDISIYKIDSSKLIKIGEEGYQSGQEQAKIYFDTIPQTEEFTIEIFNEKMQREIAEMMSVDVNIHRGILLSVDNRDIEHVGMTAFYISSKSDSVQHFVVSYANTDKESYYDLANKILNYIDDAARSQINKKREIKQKSVDDIISYAKQFFEKNSNGVTDKSTKETEKEM